MKKSLLTATAAVALLLPGAGFSQDVSSRISALEKELAILKRQLEVKQEEQKSKKQANVEIGKKGVSITSPDKEYALRIKGVAQVDGRFFLEDDANTGKDEIIARRLRPTFEGDVQDFSFRLTPDFAGGTAKIYDAYVDYKAVDAANVRVGKFKPPVGLERLQSSSNLLFVERGLPNSLVVGRDFGVQLSGKLIPDTLEYQLGVFNGNPDGTSDDGDDDDKKDVAARLFANPFSQFDVVALRGFGIGVGGSVGERDGSASNTILSDYKSPGQQSVFRYSTGTFAEGTHWRAAPQANFYYGPFGAFAEYTVSSQEVENAATQAKLEHKAWQVAASYLLTGESATPNGVSPENDFSLENGGWGAWEIAARYGQLDLDDDAFPIFASAAASVSEETSAGLGVNWYLNPNVKWVADYNLTWFEGGAAGGGDRPDEHALFTRVQYQF